MYKFFISLINALIRGLGYIVTFIFSLLPDSPFQKFLESNNPIKDYLGYINYFVPVAEMLITFEAVLVSVSVYYVYQIVARWIKMIE